MKDNRSQQKFSFIGLRKHTHEQRTFIIKKRIVPLLKRELGENLAAIAADGSYARNEDTGFSDIEMMIFVKEKKNLPHGFARIINGILVEGLFVTEEEYCKNTIEPNENWYISGSDVLLPIINRPFIDKIKQYKVTNSSKKCFSCAKDLLFDIQESFGKLFTVIDEQNKENIFPVIADVVMQTLKLIAFINEKPYKTLSSFIAQAREFKIQPGGFDEFIQIIVDGLYCDFSILEECAKTLFAGIEAFFMRKMGRNIYNSELSTIAKKQQGMSPC